MKDDIEAFEETSRGKVSAKGEKVSATASINELVAQGISTAQCLDAIIRNIYRDDSAHACRVDSRPPHRTRR